MTDTIPAQPLRIQERLTSLKGNPAFVGFPPDDPMAALVLEDFPVACPELHGAMLPHEYVVTLYRHVNTDMYAVELNTGDVLFEQRMVEYTPDTVTPTLGLV